MFQLKLNSKNIKDMNFRKGSEIYKSNT